MGDEVVGRCLGAAANEKIEFNKAAGASPRPTIQGCRYLADKSKFETMRKGSRGGSLGILALDFIRETWRVPFPLFRIRVGWAYAVCESRRGR